MLTRHLCWMLCWMSADCSSDDPPSLLVTGGRRSATRLWGHRNSDVTHTRAGRHIIRFHRESSPLSLSLSRQGNYFYHLFICYCSDLTCCVNKSKLSKQTNKQTYKCIFLQFWKWVRFFFHLKADKSAHDQKQKSLICFRAGEQQTNAARARRALPNRLLRVKMMVAASAVQANACLCEGGSNTTKPFFKARPNCQKSEPCDLPADRKWVAGCKTEVLKVEQRPCQSEVSINPPGNTWLHFP